MSHTLHTLLDSHIRFHYYFISEKINGGKQYFFYRFVQGFYHLKFEFLP